MHYLPETGELLHAVQTLSQFTTWLSDSGGDLIDAADLLGGSKWLPVALRVIHVAEAGGDLGAVLRELKQLRGLLQLEFVADLRSDEARCFLRVHPDDPRADNARVCAEALDQGIRALGHIRSVSTEGAA